MGSFMGGIRFVYHVSQNHIHFNKCRSLINGPMSTRQSTFSSLAVPEHILHQQPIFFQELVVGT